MITRVERIIFSDRREQDDDKFSRLWDGLGSGQMVNLELFVVISSRRPHSAICVASVADAYNLTKPPEISSHFLEAVFFKAPKGIASTDIHLCSPRVWLERQPACAAEAPHRVHGRALRV